MLNARVRVLVTPVVIGTEPCGLVVHHAYPWERGR
jgi:hypothetical protein